MWWFILGFVSFIVFFGVISSVVEQERDKEYIEETSKQFSKAAEWWYGKKKDISSYVGSNQKYTR